MKRHTLGSMFAAIFRPFVEAWRDETGARKVEPAPLIQPEPAPTPVTEPQTVAVFLDVMREELAKLEPAPVAKPKPTRKPRAKGKAKPAPAVERKTAKPKTRNNRKKSSR